MLDKIKTFPADFFWARLQELENARPINQVELARIAGYNRSTFQRMKKSLQSPRMEMVWRLAEHFEVDVSFFFPSRGDTLPVHWPHARECVCADASPMSREILKVFQKLPVPSKQRAINIVSQLSKRNTNEVRCISQRLTKAAQKLSPEQKEKLLEIIAEWRECEAGP